MRVWKGKVDGRARDDRVWVSEVRKEKKILWGSVQLRKWGKMKIEGVKVINDGVKGVNVDDSASSKPQESLLKEGGTLLLVEGF